MRHMLLLSAGVVTVVTGWMALVPMYAGGPPQAPTASVAPATTPAAEGATPAAPAPSPVP